MPTTLHKKADQFLDTAYIITVLIYKYVRYDYVVVETNRKHSSWHTQLRKLLRKLKKKQTYVDHLDRMLEEKHVKCCVHFLSP